MTGELQSATVFAGPSGVLLGAAEEALTAPVPIWVHEVPAPPEPLFNGAVPVGGYYNLGAECTTFSPQDKPFALGLPAPEGADASRLAVAVLAPASYTVDGPLSGELWEPVTGFYDAEENLFVVPMAALIGEGATVVLIDYPGIGLPVLPAPETPAPPRTIPQRSTTCGASATSTTSPPVGRTRSTSSDSDAGGTSHLRRAGVRDSVSL